MTIAHVGRVGNGPLRDDRHSVGRKTNTVTVEAEQTDVTPSDNAASAAVDVTGGAEVVVRPILECVDQLSGGTYRAHFGYLNAGSATIGVPIGLRNTSLRRRRTVASRCASGPDAPPMSSRSTSSARCEWTLTGRTAMASANSPRCAPDDGVAAGSTRSSARPTIQAVQPRDRRGARRHRSRGRASRDNRRRGGGRREHRVGEEGARRDVPGGLRHDDRLSTTTVGGATWSSTFRGPELIVDVAAGQEVVCTIVNTRRTGPPMPPNPTPPGPTSPSSPQPGTSDLAVQKFVSARVAARGEIVEWTVIVTNNGPQTATGVTITDDAAALATIVSLQVSQGTCSQNHLLPRHDPAGWVGADRRPHAHADDRRPSEHRRRSRRAA